VQNFILKFVAVAEKTANNLGNYFLPHLVYHTDCKLYYNDVGVSRRRPELATTNCSAHAWRHHRAL